MMNSNLTKICYKGEAGESDLRTLVIDEILYISLRDVLVTLNKENREINADYTVKSMVGIIRAQLQALDPDEYMAIDVENGVFEGQREIFVTQPGLYRVMSSDRSAAGKRFQKWLFHEVIPSLTKHGVYPPPPEAKGSAFAQMAEMLAQNSRMLADAIHKHEKLAEDVSQVKGKVADVESRLEILESGSSHLTEDVQTLKDRLVFLDICLEEKHVPETLAWCENISMKNNRKVVRGDSRENSLFTTQTIDEAISIMNDNGRISSK
ncbi:BRO family protein [Photorhabdus sp. APURE]|uniref:BRO-N domain-containing protein n=1 Tax=Photorhabdus aballayi TaxID=2991723 RepID=UPI00223CC221|nr:BRO family protein [Photorhabdus aballayi]MCW7547056.1 BRO family protein [Photorhabdus aballayi]